MLKKTVFTKIYSLGFVLLFFSNVQYLSFSNEQKLPNYSTVQSATVITLLGKNDELGRPSLGGFANGQLDRALVSNPAGLVTDPEGNLIIADAGNHQVRKITPFGLVTTIAGNIKNWSFKRSGYVDGSSQEARFNFLQGVALDLKGNLYVTDTRNNVIRKISPEGIVSTFAGLGIKDNSKGHIDGPLNQAKFNYPYDLVIDSKGNIIISDQGNSCIRKISIDGIVSTLAGKEHSKRFASIDGVGNNAQFNSPRGICIDFQDNIYVVDQKCIRKVTPNGTVTTIAGKDDVDYIDQLVLSKESNIEPQIDDVDGTGQAAKFHSPKDIAIDAQGNLYVADQQKIRLITKDGKVNTFAGNSLAVGIKDGPLSQARFRNLENITIDKNGNIYLTDGDSIRKISFDR